MLENFLTMDFPHDTRRWIVFAFFWSGFSIWIGLFARIIVPSRIFRSPWATFMLGCIGVALGPLVVKTITGSTDFEPISPSGIASALGFSVLATAIYFIFAFLFPRRDDEEEEVQTKKDELQEFEDLEEKYKDVSQAELLRAFDRSRRQEERLKNR